MFFFGQTNQINSITKIREVQVLRIDVTHSRLFRYHLIDQAYTVSEMIHSYKHPHSQHKAHIRIDLNCVHCVYTQTHAIHIPQ